MVMIAFPSLLQFSFMTCLENEKTVLGGPLLKCIWLEIRVVFEENKSQLKKHLHRKEL